MSSNNAIPVLSTTCPKCGQVNTPRGKSQTLAIVCAGCNTYFNVGKWNDEQVVFNEKHTAAIPVGSKGKIDGTVYEVMGFAVKCDKKYGYKWREYFLFNPYEGIAFLSEYDGHWTFIWPIEGNPKGKTTRRTFRFESREYQLFQKYRANVLFAQGEFFFDLFELADNTINEEYIAPPYLLSLELHENSMLWCKGEYIERSELVAAFKLNASKLPQKNGIGYTQPAVKAKFTDQALVSLCVIFALIIVGFQIFLSSISEEKTVFTQSYGRRPQSEPEKAIVTPSFDLAGSSKSLDITLQSPVDNQWFYADLTLVNETTGVEYNFSKEVAYYHGYEDGASWTEGSTIGEAFLSKIPGGRYHINIYPEFGASDSFTIWVVRDVTNLSNMFVALVGVLLLPVIYFVWKYNREKSRWSESDYSPYGE